MKKYKSPDLLETFKLMNDSLLQFEIERRAERVEAQKVSLHNNLLFIKEAKKELIRRARKEK